MFKTEGETVHINQRVEERSIECDAEWLGVVADAIDNTERNYRGEIFLTDKIAKEISYRLKLIAERICDKKYLSPPP